jgi:hypothetical protein
MGRSGGAEVCSVVSRLGCSPCAGGCQGVHRFNARPEIQRAEKKIHFVVLVFSYQPKPLVELWEILAIV